MHVKEAQLHYGVYDSISAAPGVSTPDFGNLLRSLLSLITTRASWLFLMPDCSGIYEAKLSLSPRFHGRLLLLLSGRVRSWVRWPR